VGNDDLDVETAAGAAWAETRPFLIGAVSGLYPAMKAARLPPPKPSAPPETEALPLVQS
jgi:hypothetical protein